MAFKEELSGGGGKAADVKSVLRMQHLQKLTLWAGGEASMPSYAAFLGNRLGNCGEATGIPLDPSLFACQRCESILQPGSNCTVRVETNGAKVRRRRNKLYVPPKNIVVYTCQFCSHRNVKKGTPKRHMKEIFASKLKKGFEVEPTTTGKKLACPESAAKEVKGISDSIAKNNVSQPASNSDNSLIHPELSKEVSVENSPTTPKLLLLESKRKRKQSKGSVSKEQVGNEKGTATPIVEKKAGESSRKRRKGWSSLKEIAENSASNRNISNITLPFFM